MFNEENINKKQARLFACIAGIFMAIVLGYMFGIHIEVEHNQKKPEEPPVSAVETVEPVQQPAPQVYIVIISDDEVKTIEEVPIQPRTEPSEPAKQSITEDFDIFTPCGYTASELNSALSSEAHKGMEPYVETLIEAENTYGVNAFYLMCKLGLESGWGRYTSGDNNIGGWKNPDGSYRDFESVDACIMHIAKKLSTSYKDEVGGRLEDVCARYCPDDQYTDALIDLMIERENKIIEM